MQNLILSLNIVLPLFLLMVLGYFLKTVGMLDKVTLKKMNSLIFKAFLPCLIFYNVYTSEISDIFDKKLVFFSVGCVVASFLVLMAVIPFIEKDNKKRGVIIQGIFRSNFVIFGIPLSVALYGDGIVGSAAVLIAIVVPVYNFLAVLTLEIFRGGKPNLGKIAKGIVTNPLIIASLAGLAAMFGGLKLPGAIEDTIGDVSKITTPLALIVLGGSMDFKKTGSNAKQLAISVVGRLVLIPLVFLPLAIHMGFRDAELAILLSIFASPTAVSSFSMAQQMGGDDELAGQIVVFNTSLCVATVFLWIFALKQMGVM
ncbi:MAG: AEC family transporter [Clostridia bacterium]|nr:AEC family transporter [Clostridia bacterium]